MKMTTDETPPTFDEVIFIMDYEAGELNDDQIIEGMQRLIDSGLVWKLQGFYGRLAMNLIEAGCCTS